MSLKRKVAPFVLAYIAGWAGPTFGYDWSWFTSFVPIPLPLLIQGVSI